VKKKQEMESRNQPTADFINIVVWGKMGENCANYLQKGRLVGVQGRIQSGRYEKDGRTVYTTDVVASQVEFLEWGDSNNNNSNKSQGGYDGNSDFGGAEGFHPTENDDIPF
jgi:single-strand DNA-binding protein